MANFDEIEQKVVDGVHAVISDLKKNEPLLDEAVFKGLSEVGVPAVIAQAAAGLVATLLRSGGTAQNAPGATAEPAPAEPEPAAG